MGMWDEVKANQSRRLIVAAERCTGKTSAICDMVCASPHNAVIVARDSVTNNSRTEHMLYAKKPGKKHISIPIPQAIYGVKMESPYDLYIDEPWYKENLVDILKHFHDACRVILVGTCGESKTDGEHEATRLWHSGEWTTINLLDGYHSVPIYVGGMTLADRIIAEVTRLRDDINRNPYTDVTVKVQDGRVVLTEILTKHKPA